MRKMRVTIAVAAIAALAFSAFARAEGRSRCASWARARLKWTRPHVARSGWVPRAASKSATALLASGADAGARTWLLAIARYKAISAMRRMSCAAPVDVSEAWTNTPRAFVST